MKDLTQNPDVEANRVKPPALSPEDRHAAEQWIRGHFRPASRPCPSGTYFLKHELQRATGIYTTNGEFAWLLRAVGFEAAPKELDRPRFTYRFLLKLLPSPPANRRHARLRRCPPLEDLSRREAA
jgi:hypothetical protein